MCRSSTSSSDRAAWALALRFLVFLVPILSVAGLVELAMYRVGESWPLSKSTAERRKYDELIVSRTLFSQQFNVFKPAILRDEAPDIVVLGSSRVMKFRDFMFSPYQDSFYNAGSLIQDVSDLVAYAGHVRAGRLPAPKLLIVGIDNWWLFPWKRWQESWIESLEARDAVYLPVAHVEATRELIWNVQHGYFPFRALMTGVPAPARLTGENAVGMLAVSLGSGFRKDGSRADPQQARDLIEENDAPRRVSDKTMWAARFRRGHFADAALDTVMLDRTLRAIATLKSLGTEVVVYLPPFANRLVRALENTGPMPRWWDDFYEGLPERLGAEGMVCVSVPSPRALALTDDYMLDGVHPSEVFIARVVLKMVRDAPRGSMLARVDTTGLVEKLRAPDTVPVAFDVPDEWLQDGR